MKTKVLLLVSALVLTLGACTDKNNTSDSTSTSSQSETPSSSSSSEAWEGKTNEDFEKAAITYTENGVEKPLNRNTLYTNAGSPHVDGYHIGEAATIHAMVVPFGFTDDDLQSRQTAANIERFKTCFFGTNEEIQAKGGLYSLAGFYQQSSYGHSDFQGQVLPTWCLYNGTTNQFAAAASGSGGVFAANYARNWYINEYAKENHGALGADAHPLTWFDVNNDGYIDLMWVVYSKDYKSSTDWWAYVTYTANPANLTSPNVKTLAWASLRFLDGGYGGYDTHTFIHETGHTFGLDDYYDYNDSWAPMGGVDYMDHNLGDHSMFSKFTLGWTSPWVVDDDALITLRPGTTTGDCFILPSPNYNGTAFDEYFMLELMAPVGLAEQDYKNGYSYTYGYTQPGIRITHVDNRAYSTNHDVPVNDNWSTAKAIRIGNSYMGRSGVKYDGDYWTHGVDDRTSYSQFSIMEANCDPENNWTLSSTYNASNNSLFKEKGFFNLKSQWGWAKTFMPSKTNLWNKAKTTTGWTGRDTQTYEIDESCTFNYSIKVVSIAADAEYGWVAKVQVTANAY